MRTLSSPLLSGLVFISAVFAVTPAGALNPRVLKLHGPAQSGDATNFQLGSATALSDRWAVVGEPSNDDKQIVSGAVRIFDPASGRLLRTLYSPAPWAGGSFGAAVAVSGDVVAVGEPEVAGGGRVHLFDARTGGLKATVPAPVGALGFGWAVALTVEDLLVGAPFTNGNAGRAYCYDLRSDPATFTPVALPASAPSTNHFAGVSVAITGGVMIIGGNGNSGMGRVWAERREGGAVWTKILPGEDLGVKVAASAGKVLVTNRNDGGKVHVYDVRTGSELPYSPLAPTNVAVGDDFGMGLAVDGHLVLIGAPGRDYQGNDAGCFYLYDLQTGEELGKFFAPDAAADDFFGWSVALFGGRALVGAPNDDDLGDASGSAYLFDPVAGPLPLRLVMKVGDSAPGGFPEVAIKSIGPAYSNIGGNARVLATLGGRGVTAANRLAVFSEANGVPMRFEARQSDSLGALGGSYLPGTRLGKIHSFWGHASSLRLMEADLAGQGVNAANRRAILGVNAGVISPIFRTGDPLISLPGNPVPARFGQFTQSHGTTVGALFHLRRGTGGVTAKNDSGVAICSVPVVSHTIFREGVAFGPDTVGQFLPRLVMDRFGASAWAFYRIPSVGRPVQQLVINNMAAASVGDPATGPVGGEFASFLDMGIGFNGVAYFRASLRGAGVNSGNREGLWMSVASQIFHLAQTGQEVDPVNLPGVGIRRFFGFWGSGTSIVLMHVQLRGPGINARNDGALILVRNLATTPTYQIVCREGDGLGTSDGAMIGTIQRLEVDASFDANYALLCSLTGAAGRNQALLEDVLGTSASQLSARGFNSYAVLRKGTRFASPTGFGSTGLRSLTLPARAQVGNGGPLAVNLGNLVVTALFDNGAREVLAGRP